MSLALKMAQNIILASRKNIVIFGGSYSGVSTVHYLFKHAIPQLLDKASYQMIIVSASLQAMCRPACPRALISDDMFPQEKLFVDIPKFFEQYSNDSFRFIQCTATELDHTDRSVSISLLTGDTKKINFYALLVATGASTSSPLLGLNRDNEHLRANWAAFRKALPSAKNIVIIGGGPAGIETAGELGEHVNGRAGWFSSKLASPMVPITVMTSGSLILPALPTCHCEESRAVSCQSRRGHRQERAGEDVEPQGAGTDNVTANATLTLKDGTTLDADLYIPATGTRPNTGFVHETLLTADGRVDTNASTLRVDKAGPRIYAVGDAASYARPAIHLSHP